MFTLAELEAAVPVVRAAMPPTPQFAWPLLRQRTGVDVVIKHENHTPTGAFKVRGGIVYVDRLKRERPQVKGVITATRGNHGQSLAFACGRAGIACTVVVPFGNSTEKNAAMQAFGAELIEHGRDFDEARERAAEIAQERGYEYGKSFDNDLVLGVATYAHELFTAEPKLDAVFVPIGLGSGICGVIGARDALGHKAQVFGVVSDRANTYKLSLDAGRLVPTNSALTFADGHGGAHSGCPGVRHHAGRHGGADRSDRRRGRRRDPRALHRHAHAGRRRGRGGVRCADARARQAQGKAGRRDRLGAEHRPALDGDRARRRHAGGRVRRSGAEPTRERAK
jgi:threonine dehydratase